MIAEKSACQKLIGFLHGKFGDLADLGRPFRVYSLPPRILSNAPESVLALKMGRSTSFDHVTTLQFHYDLHVSSR